jgi:hypothetical protein
LLIGHAPDDEPSFHPSASNVGNETVEASPLQLLTGKFLAILSSLPVSSPLEVIGDIFPGSNVFQQMIEASRRAPEHLPVCVHCGLQHLIEAARRSLQLLRFFIRDRLFQSLLVRPNQAYDALPEIVFPAFFVFVIHGPNKKQNTENSIEANLPPS